LELIPAIDFDTANINVSINDPSAEPAQNGNKIYNDDEAPTVAWHHDSFPFVCVTMLSDCTGMVGGETVLKTANGGVMKVRGPTMVCPIVPYTSDICTSSNIAIGNGRSHARPIYRAPGLEGLRRP
jgi:hypothetical protein